MSLRTGSSRAYSRLIVAVRARKRVVRVLDTRVNIQSAKSESEDDVAIVTVDPVTGT